MATMDNNIGAGRTIDNYIYQPGGKFIEKSIAYIAFMLRGANVRDPRPVPVPGRDRESDALSTTSTATATDIPGTGRIIDKCIYQVLGRMLENCAGRIAMSTYLSANTIRRTIEGVWYNVEIKEPCFVCQAASVREMSVEEKVRMALSRVEDAPSGAFILSGIKELTKRLR